MTTKRRKRTIASVGAGVVDPGGTGMAAGYMIGKAIRKATKSSKPPKKGKRK